MTGFTGCGQQENFKNMKKLFFGLLFMLASSLSAQSYLRAESFSMGVRQSEGSPITWGETTECSILIELYETKVVINSKVLQTYYVINQITNFTPGVVSWMCKDLNGTTCKFTMMRMEKYPGYMVCQVDYNDAIWFYVCTKN